MSGEKQEAAAQPSYLELSDEEVLKMTPPVGQVVVDTPADTNTGVAVEGDDDTPTNTEVETPEAGEAADDAAGASQAAAGAAEAGESGEKDDKPADQTPAGENKDKKPEGEGEANPKAEGENKEAKPGEQAPAPINYEAEYNRLLTPFKANGREIKVESVDDAIALMQMGANYNKKMAALKPTMKLVKMLDKSGFLSEDKIGFLIDLGKKDPAAINKLVEESGIDPMDLSADKAKAYKQTSYAVGDHEIDLDTVLDDLKESPAYTRTLDVVGNKWDVASKQQIQQTPDLLKVINAHIESGIYDLISTQVERDRMLGRLTGLSDIEAYRQVGDSINARGGFNHLLKPKADQASKTPDTAPVIVAPKPKEPVDDKLKDKRRAASSTQPAAPGAVQSDLNPLGMSDEEFSKLATPRYV